MPLCELEADRYLDDQNYDQDQDGKVLASDLARISVSTGENITLEQANALIAAWDQNGDGSLSRKCSLLCHAHLII